MEKKEHSRTSGGNTSWCSHCGRQCDGSSKKLKIDSSYNPIIPLGGIYPKMKKKIYAPLCLLHIIYNSQHMQVAQVAIARWMDKEEVRYLSIYI